MTGMYIDADTAPDSRNDHAIKLHGPEAFAGMRAAGRLAALQDPAGQAELRAALRVE